MTLTKSNNVAPIFAISRFRMGIDGNGITTLVTFMGCPLTCKYCPNKICHDVYDTNTLKGNNHKIMYLTPQDLYDMVKRDNIYFQSTGGGICFGGGEPTLYADFIQEFRKICGGKWSITLETCLVCSSSTIKQLSNIVDHWIVDIKSLDPYVYKNYTNQTSAIRETLKILQETIPNDRVTIKGPYIPGYNDINSIYSDILQIKTLYGYTNVHKVEYKIIE